MRTVIALLAVVGLAVAAGCGRPPDIDEVPVGSSVQVTREDGALVEGRLSDRNPDAVRVDVGPTTRAVPRNEIIDFRVKGPHTGDAPPPAAKFREVTVPADAKMAIRLHMPVGSAISRFEEAVHGTLAKPIVVDGATVIPAGAEVAGVVTRAQPAGQVEGRASLAFHFDRLVVDDQSYPLNARFARTASSTTDKDAEKIAIPATGGAIIGAILGGNKGAAIGAAAGGGAGAAYVLSTPGEDIALEPGTVLSLETGRTFVVRVSLRVASTEDAGR